ncbi:MAG: hypothetical protein HFH72_10255 [Lachnospiraceae bacterium]|nr:hypothetical protein [Lachnospiraceae bacterium]
MKILSKLKLLFTPTDEYDAVNKKYVDNLVSSIGEVKGVKGEAELDYRKGLVNVTPENIGAYSKAEIDSFINVLQYTVDTLTNTVAIIDEKISSGDIIATNNITDNDGNIIVTNMEEPLGITQRTS